MVVSTPYVFNPYCRPKLSDIATPGHIDANCTSRFQSNAFDLSNKTKVLAAAVHKAILEPHVFTGDGIISPEDWLRSVNVYRSSLNLSNAQIPRELPRFLAKPADNKEPIWSIFLSAVCC